jgi:hypothetical protein
LPIDPVRPGGGGIRAAAFGLCWHSDVPLAPSFDERAPCDTADVRIYPIAQLPDRGPGACVRRGLVFADGIRFVAGQVATFDMIGGDRIAYCPGPDWRGALPAAFFGSVTALTLAWRGAVPFHACAVELAGRAILIAGPSGTGKSSLTAGLTMLGARFVADDLSVVTVSAGAGRVFPGRTTMRLHAAAAALIDSVQSRPVPGDPRGKWLVQPRARASAASLPLAGMLVLGARTGATAPLARVPLLHAQLFRPFWLAALPGHRDLLTTLIGSASDLPVVGFPAITAYDPPHQASRARDALALIEACLL